MKPTNVTMLRRVKLLHTLIWGMMAMAILGLPWLALTRRFSLACCVTLLVIGEGVVLASNRWRCPLTNVAARYTTERHDNFDIYLPVWLARYNKLIFTTLFVFGEMLVVVLWFSRT
jgi:hypothetical protein